MPFVLRSENDTDNPILAVPYGKQSTRGMLVFYDKGGPTGTQTKFICILGLGEMDGVDRVLYGANTLPEFDEQGNRIWMFHPGTQSTGFDDPVQGRPTFFPELDFTFSQIAYIEVLLPASLSTDDQDEPSKMFFFVRGRKVQDYTVSGNDLVPSGSKIFSANNALVAADIMTSFMNLPLSRIHGPSWQAFKTRCDEQLPWIGGNNTVDEPTFINIIGAEETGNGGIARNSPGEGWNQAGAKTRNFLAAGTDGYFEVVAGQGTFTAGWTNSVNVDSDEEIILGVQCNFANVYSVVISGVTSARTAWSPGNVFRFGVQSGQFYIEHNGTRIASTGFPSVPSTSLWGGVAFFHDESSIQSSTFYPASTSTTPTETKTTPRYEAHVVFVADTDASSALASVMLRAPGCHWQDVNGRIKFITTPTIFDITGGASLPDGGRALVGSLTYDPTQVTVRSNIVEASFSAYRKSVFDKPNFLRASFRNKDSELYETAYSFADRKELRAQAKALIDPGIVALGMGTQSLSDRIIETQMRLTSDLDLFVTVKGQANTHHFAKGDIVRLSHDVPGWRELDPPLFIIVNESFESTVGEGGAADERSFTLQLYSPDFYTDDSHGPVSGVVSSTLTSTFSPPPVAESLTLSEDARILPDGTVIPVIEGIVQFAPFAYRQLGQVWIKRPGSADYVFTNINLTPDLTTNAASFSLDAVSSGTHFIKIVTSSLSGISRPDSEQLVESITVSGFGSLSAPNAPATLDVAIVNSMVKWTWPKSTSPGIDFYELRDESDNVVFKGNALTYTEIPASSTMTRRIYAHNVAGLYSSSYAENTFSFAAPSAVADYTFSLDQTFLTHKFTANAASERVAYYEVASDLSFTNIIWKGNTTTFSEKVTSSFTSRTVTRHIRAVNIFGATSTVFTQTITFSPPAAPTLSIDRDYPSSKEIKIVGPTDTGPIVNTVVEISTGTGGSFSSNIIETRIIDGMESHQVVNGRVTTNTSLYVKAYLKDVFTSIINDPQRSSELTLTFTVFGSGDIGSLASSNLPDGILTAAMFASGIRPVQIFTTSTTTLPTLPDANYPSNVSVLYWPNATNIANRGLWRNENNVWQHYVDGTAIVASSITSGQIAAGAISAQQIAAGAVRADKLAVGLGANLLLNPSFEDGTSAGWGGDGLRPLGTVTALSDAPHGDYAIRLAPTGSVISKAIPVVPGKKYLIRCRIRSTTSDGQHWIRIFQCPDFPSSGFASDGVGATSTDLRSSVNNSTVTAWTAETTEAFVYTIPASMYWLSIDVFQIGGTGNLDVDDFEISQVIGGAWIADAAIGTAHIQDASITNAKIVDATITSAKINSLFADKLVAAVGDIGILFGDKIISRDFVAVPNASTLLNGAISDSATTVTVDSTTGFPTSGSISIFNADGGREVVYYTGKTSTTFTGCVRAQEFSMATAHPDNAQVSARGIGWMLHPQRGTGTPGAMETNSGVVSQGVPITETTFRAVGAISDNKLWRGNTTDIVPSSYISRGYIESYYGDLDRAYASLGINIDNFGEAASGYGSIDICEIIIFNKFGERVTPDERLYRSWKGQGHIGDFVFARKHADTWEEAAFQVRIHNYHGWSDPIWISNGVKNAAWGSNIWSASGSFPSFLARQNCPLDLVAVADGPDTVKFTWKAATSNQGTQFVNARKRGPDGWEAWLNISGAGLSGSTTSFTWTGASPFTDYEFYVTNSGSTGAKSNINYCKTTPLGVTISRPAPSNLAGSAQSSTSIVWVWTRNATDNTDVEYSIDGGSWTSLGSASATTVTSTVGAGTSHTLRVRNVWSSGTLTSAETGSNTVTTPANNPASTDPSGLSLVGNLDSIDASWINNGSVNQTLEYKLSSVGTWTTVSLGAVNSYTITGLLSGQYYNVRVKATGGTNYTTATTSTQQYEDDPDPFCVLTNSLITLDSGAVLQAAYLKDTSVVRNGKGQSNPLKSISLGKTTRIYFVTSEDGHVLGCSPSHPFITNMEETSTKVAAQLKVGDALKMNDGNEYMSKVAAIEIVDAEAIVWICSTEGPLHTFIANCFVCHNIKPFRNV